MKDLTKNQIADLKTKFNSILKEARNPEIDNEDKISGTWFIRLGRIGNNDYAIAIAYQDGFDKDSCEFSVDGHNYSLCAKVAYQPKNSIMQCDYDIDWLLPYDAETGDVYWGNLSFISKSDFDYLIENWKSILKMED